MEKFGPGTGNVYLKNMNCTGPEWKIDQCPPPVNWKVSDCPHSLDVGISCKHGSASTAGTVLTAKNNSDVMFCLQSCQGL